MACGIFYCSLVTEILKETADATEVELSRDGTWRVTKEQERDCDSPDMQMASKQPDVVHTVEKGNFLWLHLLFCSYKSLCCLIVEL